MKPTRIPRWSAWHRASTRTLLAIVFFFAIGLASIRWQIQSYRYEWVVEQSALADMRKAGGRFTVGTRPVGPTWLRTLGGTDRSKYLDRVSGLYFTASDCRLADRYRKAFKHLVVVFQD